ncbi:RNA polymerase Rpb6 [Paludibacter sp. 221]|uniref:DNA-directed RNA polymerase subunit omega n=1 Tax=Paludibacter sp. 221 TaxID=2302939 RepID=UPI0013D04DA8|nr:DNA-directed RNA polymerase subunit omega [Paludibacter sp. 221]NDV47826.1 RNA polymerase Rpb6 [Paludibacter sp. 221]
MDYKKVNAPLNTVTRDMNALSAEVGNVYETVKIIAKRSNQITAEMKSELEKKLQEFASYNDNIEEIFENREQIEISRFYEKLPKATLIAAQEFDEGKVYYRNPLKDGAKVK